ncbi:MAG: hydrogenase maturation protease [Bacteroidales bacterium]|nr:hydrogenase maturation protease [Bacteroidales bacterium]HOI33184.1 hydrogenase maturation protease [Bacteroidales bacterium]
MNQKPSILIFGYGNPGRQDDGLGAAFIEKMEQWVEKMGWNNLTLDTNYQLNIEDAEQIAAYDYVFFVDASIEPIEQFSFTKVEPSDAKVEFTMHAVSPAFVLDLCRKLFSRTPETWLLHLKGYHWEFEEKLSEGAKNNLEAALEFFQQYLIKKLNN